MVMMVVLVLWLKFQLLCSERLCWRGPGATRMTFEQWSLSKMPVWLTVSLSSVTPKPSTLRCKCPLSKAEGPCTPLESMFIPGGSPVTSQKIKDRSIGLSPSLTRLASVNRFPNLKKIPRSVGLGKFYGMFAMRFLPLVGICFCINRFPQRSACRSD